MKREDLKAMGLPDEQINTIMDLHGADIERQKTTVSTLTAERDELKERLEEANGKLEGYDPEWKTKAGQAQSEADRKIADIQRGYVLKEHSAGLKFTSESARRAFLSDLEAANLPLQDEKLLGFEAFVKQYREADPGAFAPDKPAPTITIPGQGRPPQKSSQQFLDEKYKDNPFYHSKGE